MQYEYDAGVWNRAEKYDNPRQVMGKEYDADGKCYEPLYTDHLSRTGDNKTNGKISQYDTHYWCRFVGVFNLLYGSAMAATTVICCYFDYWHLLRSHLGGDVS